MLQIMFHLSQININKSVDFSRAVLFDDSLIGRVVIRNFIELSRYEREYIVICDALILAQLRDIFA